MNGVRPPYRRRSIFGPLLVAAIGVLFLLHNFGVIPSRNFGLLFARYWPLLLILWGLVKLGEYLWARQRNEPYPGIGAGAVVFVVFLVLFGSAATGISRVDWGWYDYGPNDDWGFGIFGNRYDFTQSFAQPMPAASQVKILSSRGGVTITPSPDSDAHVVVHKYTRTDSQDEANNFDNSTRPKFEQQGTVWLLDLTGGNFARGRFDLVVQVPPKYPVSLVATRGDVHVSQMQADLELEANHGDIAVEQIKGNVLLRPHRHHITARNVTGDVSIDGDVGDSTVSDVTGAVNYSTGLAGDIELSHITGTVHFRSLRTDLQFGKLDGDLTMDGGNLHANAVAGPLTLSTRTKDVQLEDVTGSIHIDDSTGNIEVQTKAPLGNVDITTTGGQISVSLPEKAGFQVDAQSNYGGIQSDFALSINNQSENATASGTVGKGGPAVRLRTNRGTIQIHKIG